MFLGSVAKQIKYNCDPDKIIHKIAVHKDFMPLAHPIPACEVLCPRCGGTFGFYIPSEKAWGCIETTCLKWQIGYETGPTGKFESRPYKKILLTDYGVPEQYEAASISDFSQEKELIYGLRAVVDKKTNYMLLAGSNGTGKTHAACAGILQYLQTGGRNCRFINASMLHKEWKLELQNGTGFSTIEKYSEYDFLVIDDLGVHTPTEMFMDSLYMILDQRMTKSTIVTTNMISQELKMKFGGAIFSRIASGVIKKMSGIDRRFQREWVC